MKSKKYIVLIGVVFVLALLLVGFNPAAPVAQATATATPKPTATFMPTHTVAVPNVKEWQGSGHGDYRGEAFAHWNNDTPAEVPAGCAKCHSAYGFQEFAATGKNSKNVAVGSVVNCVTCHNESASKITKVIFPSGVAIKTSGSELLCLNCHQGRESEISVNNRIQTAVAPTNTPGPTATKPAVTSTPDPKATPVKIALLPVDADKVLPSLAFANIHYFAAGVSRYGTLVKGGYEYEGKEYDGRFNHVEGVDDCADCHDVHSLEVKVEVCATCHPGVKKVEELKTIRMVGSSVDFDGDGNMKESINDEITGLQEKLYATIQEYAKTVGGKAIVYSATTYPYWILDANANGKVDAGEGAYNAYTPRLLKAAYNYQVSVKDPGAYAHGGKYIIELLFDAIEDLGAKVKVDLSKAHRTDPGHFDGSGMAFRDWDDTGMVPTGCVKCHSGAGLPMFYQNGGTVAVSGGYSSTTTGVVPVPSSNGLECTTCHDSLTKYTRLPQAKNKVVFPSGVSLTFDEGKTDSNLCLNCHQGRSAGVLVATRVKGMEADTPVDGTKLSFMNFHYFPAGATLFGADAKGAFEYPGKKYNGRYLHVAKSADSCLDCHKASKEQHTFEINFDATCKGCHANAKSVAEIRMASGDMDGDAATEGVKGEIDTLRQQLLDAIMLYSKDVAKKPIAYTKDANPYFFVDANANGKVDAGETTRYDAWTPRLLQAAFNYQFASKDPGVYAHNAKYAAQYLIDSIEDLGTKVKVDLSKAKRP